MKKGNGLPRHASITTINALIPNIFYPFSTFCLWATFQIQNVYLEPIWFVTNYKIPPTPKLSLSAQRWPLSFQEPFPSALHHLRIVFKSNTMCGTRHAKYLKRRRGAKCHQQNSWRILDTCPGYTHLAVNFLTSV